MFGSASVRLLVDRKAEPRLDVTAIIAQLAEYIGTRRSVAHKKIKRFTWAVQKPCAEGGVHPHKQEAFLLGCTRSSTALALRPNQLVWQQSEDDRYTWAYHKVVECLGSGLV